MTDSSIYSVSDQQMKTNGKRERSLSDAHKLVGQTNKKLVINMDEIIIEDGQNTDEIIIEDGQDTDEIIIEDDQDTEDISSEEDTDSIRIDEDTDLIITKQDEN